MMIVLDKTKFLKIVMPNVNGFYPEVDTPRSVKEGVENMTKFYQIQKFW